jgi:hypothetical protein
MTPLILLFLSIVLATFMILLVALCIADVAGMLPTA